MNRTEYNEMIKTEEERHSDGKRINIYRCANGYQKITKDVHKGTTPMFNICEICPPTKPTKTLPDGSRRVGGQNVMGSQMYRVDQNLKPFHEYYRPTFEVYQKITDINVRDHVELDVISLRESVL